MSSSALQADSGDTQGGRGPKSWVGWLPFHSAAGGVAQVPHIRQRLFDRAGESFESDDRFNSKHGEHVHRIAKTRTSQVSADEKELVEKNGQKNSESGGIGTVSAAG